MFSSNVACCIAPDTRLALATFVREAPRPGVSKPEAGKYHDGGGFACPICHSNSHMNIVGRLFCVLRNDIEISILCEHPGIAKLVLGKLQAAPAVFLDQLIVRECYLGVLIKRLEVRMSWRRVEVIITLFAIFAVIAFRASESEKTFLQYGVLSVPYRQCEAKTTLAIRNAKQSVFAPAIGPASRVIMRKIAPSVSLFGVVLTYC